MKGQTFLLTAGIIIGVLVALKGFSVVSQVSSERAILDISLEDLAFKNVGDEAKNLLDVNIAYPRNVTTNSIDFLQFMRNGSYSHGTEIKILYVNALANSTNSTINITVFNYLKENNLNVSIKLNTSSVQINSSLLNDGSLFVSNFSYTPGQTFNLTIQIPSDNYEQNVSVETKNNKDTFTSFFDIRFVTERASHFQKIEQNVKIKK